MNQEEKLNKPGKLYLEEPLEPLEFLRISKILNENFPKCFPLNEIKILKKNIGKELVIKIDNKLSKTEIIKFLSHYTQTPEYIKNHQVGTLRVDLDGNPTTTITEKEYKYKMSFYKFYTKKFNLG